MGSRAGTLPIHLLDGRGAFSGPLQGTYFTPIISTQCIEGPASPEFEISAPFDMRILKISTTCMSILAGTPDIRVQNNGSDLVALTAFTVAAIDHTLVGAQRNVSKGDLLNVKLVAAAGEDVVGFTCTITGYSRGHVNVDEATDNINL